MAKVCKTAFFAATKSGADVYVGVGSVLADDDPLLKGREALFKEADADAVAPVGLNHPATGRDHSVEFADDGRTVVVDGVTFHTFEFAVEVVEYLTDGDDDTSDQPDGDDDQGDDGQPLSLIHI